jgi:D-alanine-D-alanine ligase
MTRIWFMLGSHTLAVRPDETRSSKRSAAITPWEHTAPSFGLRRLRFIWHVAARFTRRAAVLEKLSGAGTARLIPLRPTTRMKLRMPDRTPLPPQRVAVLYTNGGTSLQGDERAAADLTATADVVAATLRECGHDAQLIDFGDDPIEVGRELRGRKPNVVFNLAERPQDSNDKEPHVAAWLELLSLPYTGNGPAALSLCKDKALTKQVLLAHALPTPRFQVFANGNLRPDGLAFPLMVKPLTEDGSLAIAPDSVVENSRQLRQRVLLLREQYGQVALVEEFLAGREFSVTVLGNGTPTAPYQVLPAGELVYHSAQWRVCTFEAKWDEAHPSYAAVEAQYPGKIARTIARKLEKLSLACAEIFALRGYSRIDFRMNAAGEPCVLEINPNPDVSPGSGMSRTAQTAGFEYPQFLEEILRLGLEQGRR